MRLEAFGRTLWLKSGVYTVTAATIFAALLTLLKRAGWWYQETIWYRAWIFLNYPAGELTTLVLQGLEVPRLYDVPLTGREALITNLTVWTLAIIWWFLLGAAGSVIWRRLNRSGKPDCDVRSPSSFR